MEPIHVSNTLTLKSHLIIIKNVSNSNGNGDRKVKRLHRQVFVQELVIQGMGALQISELRDDKNKPIAKYETILRDIDEIRTEWLKADPKWMIRVHGARIEATQRLLNIQVQLNAFLSRSDDDVTIKEKIGVLGLLMANTVKLYDVQSDFDPEQYMEQKMMEHAENERQKKNLEEDSGRGISPRVFESEHR